MEKIYRKKPISLFDFDITKQASIEALKKLNIRHQIKNPVMFVVFIGSILTTGLFFRAIIEHNTYSSVFILAISFWLWFTLIFANFAESMAEGRGKAQAANLKKLRKDTIAKKISTPKYGAPYEEIYASDLKKNDIVLIEAGDTIPMDGEIIEGVASVDESAITGESAPVIRESGGDRSAVTGGTKVLSDWIIVKITSSPGETFLDHMIAMVEGAKRQKTPNEIALSILLAVFTLMFLLVVSTILPFSIYSVFIAGHGHPVSITVLVSLLICLIPTTIGGLLPAIGIAGMDRLIQENVIATSGKAVEAAGDVDVLLLDKTGTITLGNRQAVDFIPTNGVSVETLADAAQLSSLSDETPEGRSIVILAKKYNLRERQIHKMNAKFIPFSAQTRMSGVDLGNETQIRKGAVDAIEKYVKEQNGIIPEDLRNNINTISKSGGTPLVVAENNKVLGVIHLKDIVKGGIKERFFELRNMGIRTIMVTGDNPLTAAAISAEAGMDNFLAEATPETKLKYIRQMQSEGRLVAMTGDGTNDAPALAQADVAVAMNTGTQAAKEAGNMVDLDSNPTKLIEIVKIGKQLLMTRGALTTFSIANDVSKYFAIIPAAFVSIYPKLQALNIMHLTNPATAILSAVIFNAIIIIFLIPLALKGIPYKPMGANKLLKNNLLIYGIGGIITPFIGIKLIDIILSALHIFH
jgi:K+-transporting ATPase ATPase B chain